jgi:transcriptional regulator with XRE-family HTH domain
MRNPKGSREIANAPRPFDKGIKVHSANVGRSDKSVKRKLVGSSDPRRKNLRHGVGMSDASPSPKKKRRGPQKPRVSTKTTPLGKRLLELRGVAKITAAEAAAGMGWSRSYLSGVEGGTESASLSFIMTAANFYRVSIGFLMTGIAPPPRSPGQPELVYDLDELALLEFWRSLDIPDRAQMLRLLAVPRADRSAA